MPGKLYWRGSITASCMVHCLVFAGAGWLHDHLDASRAQEYIEMELIGDIAASEQAEGQSASPVPPAAKPVIVPAASPVARTVIDTSDTVAERVVPEQNSASVTSAMTSEAVVPVMTAPAESGEGYGGSGTSQDGAGTGSGTSGTGQGGSGRILAPRILSSVEPVYPEKARQDGFGGTVAVRIEVLENGRPGEVRIERSSGRSSLDEAALQAVRKWRFVPAQEAGSGRAVRCFTTLAVVFRLQ